MLEEVLYAKRRVNEPCTQNKIGSSSWIALFHIAINAKGTNKTASLYSITILKYRLTLKNLLLVTQKQVSETTNLTKLTVL
jgi:hypothetical protein